MEIIKEGNVELTLSNEIVLSIKEGEADKKYLWVIFLLVLISIVIPIGGFIHFAKSAEGIPFGFIITCIIFLGVAGYFMRLFLWNRYGKEIFILSKDKLVYYYDYHLFKDILCNSKLEIEDIFILHKSKQRKATQMLISSIGKDTYVNICFQVNGKLIVSRNMVPAGIVAKMSDVLHSYKSFIK